MGLGRMSRTREEEVPLTPTFEERPQSTWRKLLGRRRQDNYHVKLWRPITFSHTYFASTAVTTCLLITTVQLLLERSQRDSGLLFAPSIGDLPLSKTFHLSQLPAIVTILYAILWTWLDADVRRLEPYYQLSRPEGATGRDSLLLQYPVDFFASVPFKALKRKHWAVFVVSIASLLATWGLTPVQAGLFLTETVSLKQPMRMLHSTDYTPIAKQPTTFSAQSAYSVSSILWLNETLQPYMTRDSIFAPFAPDTAVDALINGTSEDWTGNTKRYSLNVTCEEPTLTVNKAGSLYMNSSWGCSFMRPVPNINNDSSPYSALYAGWPNDDGQATYSLDKACPRNESSTFFIQWSYVPLPQKEFFSLEPEEKETKSKSTRRWCRSTYYMQDVRATIEMPGHKILNHYVTGPPQPLPADLFNTTDFEGAINLGHERYFSRTDFPTANWPYLASYLSNMTVDLGMIDKITTFAVGTTQRPTADYMDGDLLEKSFENAYRLLFARQMVDVLSKDLDSSTAAEGVRAFQTEAIVVSPAFAYIAHGILGTLLLFNMFLWFTAFTRPLRLTSNPATIQSMMKLAAKDETVLNEFKGYDQATIEHLTEDFQDHRFCLRLSSEHDQPSILLERAPVSRQATMTSMVDTESKDPIALKATLPKEFRLYTGVAFAILLTAAFVALPVLFVISTRQNGLPQPSPDSFVRSLVESYIPTATGALVEPFWMLLNRQLCTLEPFDRLRKGEQTSKTSIGVDYVSLPSQFVIWKALKRGHFLLVAVCSMSLLANLFAVATSTLFFEKSVSLESKATFRQPYQLMLNTPPDYSRMDAGSATSRSMLQEPLSIAVSNITASTPLPPWADKNYAYLPFTQNESDRNSTWNIRSRTHAIGSKLDCQVANGTVVLKGRANHAEKKNEDPIGNITVITQKENRQTLCRVRLSMKSDINGRSANEFYQRMTADSGTEENALCNEYIAAGWVRANIKQGNDSILNGGDRWGNSYNITTYTAETLVCHASLEVRKADITADWQGHVQKLEHKDEEEVDLQQFTKTTPSNFISGMNQFVVDQATGMWHNDSYSSDFNNYLLRLELNQSSFLDPNMPLPKLEDMIAPVARLHRQLFATAIARNMDMLLQRNSKDQENVVDGTIMRPTPRVFMSQPMFIIAEVILFCYIIVATALYARRPWKVLVRPPSSIASVLAYFAASNAVQDFKPKRSGEDAGKPLLQHDRGTRYGFGTFLGTDGRAHIGIEKHPYLAALQKSRTKFTWHTPTAGDSEEGLEKSWFRRLSVQPSRVLQGGPV